MSVLDATVFTAWFCDKKAQQALEETCGLPKLDFLLESRVATNSELIYWHVWQFLSTAFWQCILREVDSSAIQSLLVPLSLFFFFLKHVISICGTLLPQYPWLFNQIHLAFSISITLW